MRGREEREGGREAREGRRGSVYHLSVSVFLLCSPTHILTDTIPSPSPSPSVLYRKVVSYLLLRSGLGSATDIAVVREASGEGAAPHRVRAWFSRGTHTTTVRVHLCLL